MKNVMNKGVPALVGGAIAGAVDAAVGSMVTSKMDDGTVKDIVSKVQPLVGGVVGIFLMDGKNKEMDYAAAGAMGYGTGKITNGLVAEAIGDDVLADDAIDEFIDAIKEDATDDGNSGNEDDGNTSFGL